VSYLFTLSNVNHFGLRLLLPTDSCLFELFFGVLCGDFEAEELISRGQPLYVPIQRLQRQFDFVEVASESHEHKDETSAHAMFNALERGAGIEAARNCPSNALQLP